VITELPDWTRYLGQGVQAAVTLPAEVQGERVPSLAPVIEQVAPAVVNIAVRGSVEVRNPFMEDPFFRRFFGTPEQGPGGPGGQGQQRRPFQSAGSGVIVDAAKGYLITNHHVIENAEEITITLIDGRELKAEVVGSDAGSDSAREQQPGREGAGLPDQCDGQAGRNQRLGAESC
jgi:S1-C subfamily serine protease